MKILECSSKGDKRFSAFYARVKVSGREDSIENHYQMSKRFGDSAPQSWRDAKGRKPTHFHVGGKDLPLEHLSSFYKLLWVRYLDDHPDLVGYAKGFDEFTDMFRGTSINCQADVIRQYVKEGRASIIKECKEFIELIK